MRTSGDGNSMVVLVVLIDISSLKVCVWGGGKKQGGGGVRVRVRVCV